MAAAPTIGLRHVTVVPTNYVPPSRARGGDPEPPDPERPDEEPRDEEPRDRAA